MPLSVKIKKHVLVLIILLASIPVAEAAIGNITIRVIPRMLPFVVSLGTSTLQAEPGETMNLNAYVRNAYNTSMKDVKVWFENVSEFNVEITPESIDELKPDEIRAFSVKFAIPADTREGEYVIVLQGGSRDFSDSVSDVVVLKISKVTNEVYYGTAAGCLIIISLFLWRRFEYNRKK
jgi:uncharacterized membrane protein